MIRSIDGFLLLRSILLRCSKLILSASAIFSWVIPCALQRVLRQAANSVASKYILLSFPSAVKDRSEHKKTATI